LVGWLVVWLVGWCRSGGGVGGWLVIGFRAHSIIPSHKKRNDRQADSPRRFTRLRRVRVAAIRRRLRRRPPYLTMRSHAFTRGSWRRGLWARGWWCPVVGGWSVGWLVVWLFGVVGWAGWRVGCLVFGWLVGWLVGGCLVGGLVGWFVGWVPSYSLLRSPLSTLPLLQRCLSPDRLIITDVALGSQEGRVRLTDSGVSCPWP